MAVKKYPKYKTNLYTVGDDVFSYNTKVATFKRGKGLQPLGWWSSTTSKHINYIGKMWGLTVLKPKK